VVIKSFILIIQGL